MPTRSARPLPCEGGPGSGQATETIKRPGQGPYPDLAFPCAETTGQLGVSQVFQGPASRPAADHRIRRLSLASSLSGRPEPHGGALLGADRPRIELARAPV